MKINSLTAVEEQTMQVLWTLNSFYLKDVMAQHPEPIPHQNTISTYLKILTEKGYLITEKEGRIFKYSVSIPLEKYKEHLVDELFQKFFSENRTELLQILVKKNIIEKNDLLEIFDLKIKLKDEKSEVKPSIVDEILTPKDKKKKKKKKKNKD